MAEEYKAVRSLSAVEQRRADQVTGHSTETDQSFDDLLIDSYQQDGIGPGIEDSMDSPTAEPDQPFTDEDWKKATEGIPLDMQEELTDVVSRKDLFEQSEQIRKGLEFQKKMQKAGWKGTAAQLTAGILDPVAVTAGVASDGAALPWIFAAKAGRMTRAVRAASVTGATEAGLEAATLEGRPTKGMADVLTAGAFGAAIGGAAGSLTPNRGGMDEGFSKAYQRVGREADRKAAQAEAEEYGLDIKTEQLRKIDEEIRSTDERIAEQDAELQRLDGERQATEGRTASDDFIDDLDRRVRERGETGLPEARTKTQKVARALDSPAARTELDNEFGGVPESSASEDAEAFAKSVIGKASRRKQTKQNTLNKKRAEVQASRDDLQATRDQKAAQRASVDGTEARRFGTGEASPSDPTQSTAGAAQVQGVFPEQSVNESPEVEELVSRNLDDVDEISNLSKAGISISSKLAQSSSPTVRTFAGRMFSNSIGRTKGSGKADEIDAAHTSDRLLQYWMGQFTKIADRQYKDWAKEAGKKYPMARPEVRHQFMKAVSHAIRTGESDSSYVSKAAEAIQKNNAQVLEAAKQVGIDGFQNVDEVASFLNRQWDGGKAAHLNGRTDIDNEDIIGMIKKSIKDGSESLDETTDEVADSIARTLWKRMLTQGYETDFDLHKAFFGRDVDALRELMQREGIDEQAIDRMQEVVQALNRQDEAGQVRHAKHRIQLDENTTYQLSNGETLHISDLMENDAEKLHVRYLRTMSGQIAVARKFREMGVEGPINVETEINRWMKQMNAQDGATADEVSKVNQATRMILGKPPLKNMNSNWAQGARVIRDWNFLRLMGQVGFAQVAELGPMIGQLGLKNVISNIPEIARIMKRAKDGSVSNLEMEELEEAGLVAGMEHNLYRPQYRLDEDGLEATNYRIKQGETLMDQAKQGMGIVSGMRAVTNTTQRWATIGVAQKIRRLATDAMDSSGTTDLSKLPASTRERMRSIGLDDNDLQKVLDQINTHRKKVPTEDGKRTYEVMGLDQWDDPEVREKLLGAIHKWSFRMIQRNFAGELPAWMNHPLGQIAGQFRSFMMGAYEKQLLQGLKMNDLMTYASFTGAMTFASLSYTAQQTLNSFGSDDPEGFREERLSPKNLAVSAFQRAGFASVLPALIDTTVPLTGMVDEPIFKYGRSTGLATDFLSGIPSVDLVNNAHRAVKGATTAAARDDYEYSRRDWEAFWGSLWMNNVTGIKNVGQAIERELPKRSQNNPRTIEDLM